MARARNHGAPPATPLCDVPKCGRPRYARGYCQTHHRQLLTEGEVHPIRPYRSRTPGTVKFAGLRVTPECAKRLGALAEQRGLSVGATIADVLEDAIVKGGEPESGPTRQRSRKK